MTTTRAGVRGLVLGFWSFSGVWILALGAFTCHATKVPWSEVPFAVQKEADHFVDVHSAADTHVEKGETVYHFSGNKNNKHNEVDLSSAGKFIRLEQQLGFNACPKPVQKAIRPYTAGGKLENVTRHADTTTSSYEAEITTRGDKSLFVEVDKDGKLVSTETEIALRETPPAVQKTIKAELNSAQPTYVGKYVEDGDTSFHVEVETVGKTNELWISDNGNLLERELIFVELPGAVQQAILSRMGNAADSKITKDCESGPCQYNVELIGSKDEHQFSVDITGKLVSESVGIPLDQTPEPVRKTVKDKTAGATVASVTKTQEGDKLYYEVEVIRDGNDESFDVAPDGKILD